MSFTLIEIISSCNNFSVFWVEVRSVVHSACLSGTLVSVSAGLCSTVVNRIASLLVSLFRAGVCIYEFITTVRLRLWIIFSRYISGSPSFPPIYLSTGEGGPEKDVLSRKQCSGNCVGQAHGCLVADENDVAGE